MYPVNWKAIGRRGGGSESCHGTIWSNRQLFFVELAIKCPYPKETHWNFVPASSKPIQIWGRTLVNCFIIICYHAKYWNTLYPLRRSWFLDEGSNEFKRWGSKIVPTKLCETYEIVANVGGLALHDGPLTRSFVDDVKRLGGVLSEEDMRSYRWEKMILWCSKLLLVFLG